MEYLLEFQGVYKPRKTLNLQASKPESLTRVAVLEQREKERNSYGSQCLHDEICGSWKVFKLQKQNVVQSQSNLEDSLDVNPLCSNSKAQTISFTHQKYIVNSCLIVKYGEIFYPGVVIEVLDDQRRNNFLKRHRNKRNIFVYPEVQDIQLVYADMIVTEVMLIPMAIV
ncbi:hypothetical protein BgiMline_010964 [Biomphalaria glabrata]